MANDTISIRDARRIWRSSPETREVVIELLRLNWRIRPAGGHYRARCPCGYPLSGPGVGIWSTPQNDGTHARRIRRIAAHCPDEHDLIR
jgi:hypothetical protein